jgi:CRISPR-associated protein Csx1
MKLLVASWGNFNNWKAIKYRFGEEELVNRSTLPILQKVIQPDWIIVVLPDTLGEDFTSYEGLRESIKKEVENFFEQIGIGREIDVVVVPGVGTFPNGSFQGSALDVYYTALYYFSTIVPTDTSLEVHFDSTHGLNYVTFLVYRALKDILGIAALRDSVRFLAYNSDPYVPKVSRELSINVIEDTMVEPHPVSEPLPGLDEYLVPYLMEKRVLGELKRKLRAFDLLRREKKRFEAWASSLAFGMPLLFVEEFPDIGELEGAIGELLSEWENNVEVSEKMVVRKLAFGKGFGTLVKLFFQAKATKTILPEMPPTIEDLYKIADALLRGPNRERVRVELGKIEEGAIKYASARCFPDWMPLRDFFGATHASQSIVPRNFLAHAGFEMNVTEVKMESWEGRDVKHEAKKHTFVRYSGSSKKRVLEIASEALRGG